MVPSERYIGLKGGVPYPNLVLKRTMKSFDEYNNVSGMERDGKQTNGGITHIRWEAPPIDVYRVN